MRNPTKVFCSAHFNNSFALYELPGYNKNIISKTNKASVL
jgi:hypothetical protein